MTGTMPNTIIRDEDELAFAGTATDDTLDFNSLLPVTEEFSPVSVPFSVPFSPPHDATAPLQEVINDRSVSKVRPLEARVGSVFDADGRLGRKKSNGLKISHYFSRHPFQLPFLLFLSLFSLIVTVAVRWHPIIEYFPGMTRTVTVGPTPYAHKVTRLPPHDVYHPRTTALPAVQAPPRHVAKHRKPVFVPRTTPQPTPAPTHTHHHPHPTVSPPVTVKPPSVSPPPKPTKSPTTAGDGTPTAPKTSPRLSSSAAVSHTARQTAVTTPTTVSQTP